jgi:hypothetical protein
MPYYVAAANVMLDALGAEVTHLSVHTADPTSAGLHEATGGSPAYARKVPTFGTAASGSLPLSTSVVFDLAAGTYTHIGAWAGSTFLGSGALPASRVFSTQDTLTVDQFTLAETYTP